MISVKKLSKFYGNTQILSEVNFEVNAGEVVGFLGPNGAGKTTTMRILTGYTVATSGDVTISEKDIYEESLSLRKHIGYLPESNALYENMLVHEYLEFSANVKDIADRKAEIKRVVKETQLQEKITSPISELSKGYRQRVGLADALLGDPDILILDEPTSGLDPNQATAIRKLIRTIGKTKTVIFSTHILQEARAVCDRVVIIDKGSIVAEGTIDELVHQAKGQTEINLKIEGPHEDIVKKLKELSGVQGVTAEGDEHFLVVTKGEQDVCRDIFKHCVSNNWTLLRMQTSELSLEDVFRQLTQ